jgi:hemerythrin
MSTLNFKDIILNEDPIRIKNSALAKSSFKEASIREPKTWKLGEQRTSGFNKYTETITPHFHDEDDYLNSLDFDNRELDHSFTFEDIKNNTAKEAEARDYVEDIDVQEEISQLVQDAFADYLDSHKSYIRKYRDPKLFNKVCSEVTSDILTQSNLSSYIDEMYEPGYFDDVFSQYMEEAEEKEEILDEEEPLEESTVRASLNDAIGYVAVEEPEWGDSGNGRNRQGKLEGPFLAVDDSDDSKYDTQYKLVKDIEDAELFKSEENAREALYYYIYIQGLTEDAGDYTNFYYDELVPFYKKRYHKEPKDSDYKACVRAYISSNYKVTEVFYSDLMTAPSTLKESRIGDVEILLEEFDKQYPEGNPKREEYTLTQYLMKCLGLDKESAYSIASQYLDRGYFTH